MKRLITLSIFILMMINYMNAQSTTSGISGRISSEKEPVMGVHVSATHTPSNTFYGAITNNNGRFTLTGMRTGGPYIVTIMGIGYETVKLENIYLELGSSLLINEQLRESTLSLKEVEVVGKKTKLTSEKAGIATNISQNEMKSLPTISRSLTDFARLSPYFNNGMSFIGSDGRTSGFTIDGANLNNNLGLTNDFPGGGNPISLDAIEEMQVAIAPFDIRQSNFIGGAVNAITKSGTNQFKGSVYTYFRNEQMRGNKIDGVDLGSREKEANSIYGLTLGGPIIKDKLFFFVNGEYSNSPFQITKFRPRGVADEQQNSSRVTEADMREFASILKNEYGYDAGSYDDYAGGNNNFKILTRVDWNINDEHKMSVRYNYTTDKKDMPSYGTSGVGTRATSFRMSKNAMAFTNSCYAFENSVASIAAELNSRFSNTISNRLIATYSDVASENTSNSSPFPLIDIWDGNGDAYMTAGYDLFSWNNKPKNTILNIQDNAVFYFDKHILTAGASFEYQKTRNMFMTYGTGYYKYESFDAFKQKSAPIAFGLTYGYNGEANPEPSIHQTQTALFVQDDWNITNQFKLTLGLRADMMNFLNDVATNRGYLDIDFNGQRINTGVWPKTNLLIAPRMGFNWDITEDRSLSVRGGSGIFTGRIPMVYFVNMPTNSGMLQNTVQITDNATLDLLKGGLITDVNQMVEVLGLPTTPEFNSASDIRSASIVGISPDFKMPQIWKNSIAIDYRPNISIPVTVTAEYIYNKNINAVYQENLNVIAPTNLTRFNGPDNRYFYESAAKTAIASNVTGGAMLLKNTHKGYSSALSISAAAEPVRNLNIMAAYSHMTSKEISGNPGSKSYSAWQNLPSINSPNLSNIHSSQYLSPDKVIASLSYKIEYANHFATHIGAFYTGFVPGNYSYMYTADMNQDGQKNDLMYIPASKEELIFIDKNGLTAAEQADAFWNFVNQDSYLSKHKGEYAEAYGAYLPWVHRLDLRVAQDFKIKSGKSTNTLQVSVDIMNVGNLINSSWGVPKSLSASNNGRLLKYEGINENKVPQYSMYYDAKKGLPTSTFETDRNFSNCWQIQLGVRYIFN